jgi:hypothetical protein
MSFAGKCMEQKIMLSERANLKKPNITCFYSFVEFRSKIMMVLIIGHAYKRGTV